MSNKSERLKSLKNKLNLTKFLSFICTIVPLLVYVIVGFANNEIHTGSKVFLGFTLISALILTLTNILMKYHLRSPLFIILLGIYVALDNILALMIIISVGIIIDEFILQPIIKNLKVKVSVRKELEHDGE